MRRRRRGVSSFTGLSAARHPPLHLQTLEGCLLDGWILVQQQRRHRPLDSVAPPHPAHAPQGPQRRQPLGQVAAPGMHRHARVARPLLLVLLLACLGSTRCCSCANFLLRPLYSRFFHLLHPLLLLLLIIIIIVIPGGCPTAPTSRNPIDGLGGGEL